MTTKYDIASMQAMVKKVRRDILTMVYHAQSGHPGGSLGCVEYFIALYFHIMKINKKFSMDGYNEDLFFLSNGHISPVWYSVLARVGYFSIEELSTFRKISTRLQGHPATAEALPGVRIASGSLGQGLSVAIGAALSKKLNSDNRLVYVLMGDGEQQEGQIWEAAMYAAHNQVDNIIATVDCNGQQIDGPVEKILSLQKLADKWRAFGWQVIESDGNDLPNLLLQLQAAQAFTGQKKPIINLMKTVMGKGVNFMENTHIWHGIAPSEEEYHQALEQL